MDALLTPRSRHWLMRVAHLTSLVTLAGLLLLWTGVLVHLDGAREQARAQALTSTSNLTIALREHVQHLIKEIDNVLLLVRTRQMTTVEPSGPLLIPENLQGRLILLDARGRQTEATTLDADTAQFLHADFSAASGEDRLLISRPHFDTRSARWVVGFARAFGQDSKPPKGEVVFLLDTAVLQSFYDQLDLGHTGTLLLCDTQGRVLARGAHENYGRGLGMVLAPLVTPQGDSGTLDGRSPIDAIERLGSWQRLEAQPLLVAVQRARSDVFAGYFQHRQRLLLTAATASAGLLLMLVLFLHSCRREWHELLALEHARNELATAEERWRLALENAGDGVWDCRPGNGTVFYSPEWRERLGLPGTESLPIDTVLELLHADDRDAVKARFDAHVHDETPRFRSEHRMRMADGGYRWVLSRGVAVERDATGYALRVIGTTTDVTEAHELHQQLERQTVGLRQINNRLAAKERELTRLAATDPLTGAYNRRTFMQRAELEVARALRRKMPLSLLMLDLDHFKRINDTWTHAGGDAVLKAVTQLCARLLRNQDTFARMGGEEFAVLLPDTGAFEGRSIAERLRAAIHELQITHEAETIPVTASLGVATLSAYDSDGEALLRRADVALYAAKRSGRDRVVMASSEGHTPLQPDGFDPVI